ncbi:MAG: hypothetical protein HZB59_08585 [Ignavibacteriales bacterium]|nr:hypothetical protein [Ignavibacteriales bacterium]
MMKNEEILFYVDVGWVQEEARRLIKRRLTDSELLSVKKGLEWGLTTDIDTVFEAAIEKAVELHSVKNKQHYKN